MGLTSACLLLEVKITRKRKLKVTVWLQGLSLHRSTAAAAAGDDDDDVML